MADHRIIDIHTHVFGAAVAADRGSYLARDAAFREMYTAQDAKVANAAELVAAMDDAGIERSVACAFGWADPGLCHDGNDAIIDAVATYPDRLIGFGTIAPAASVNTALEEISRLADAGVRGIGELRPDAQGLFTLPPADWQPLADALRARRMGVLLHTSDPVGRTYPGKGTATPDRLLPLLDELNDIPVILAHGGGGLPFYAHLRGMRERLSNVYVDTAAFPYLYDPTVLRALIDAIGAERVLFGTDFPLMPQQRVVDYLDTAGLSDAEGERVLYGNAAAFLDRIGATAPPA